MMMKNIVETCQLCHICGWSLVSHHGREHDAHSKGEGIVDGEGNQELVEAVAQVALHANYAEDDVAYDSQD